MSDALNPGDVIGQYTIEAELGRGPLGISYRARDGAGDVVAIKVLHTNLGLTEDEKEAFVDDFHALEQLQSPQVPVLREFVRYDDRYVIATDYLPLGDFTKRLAQGPLPLPVALTMMRHLTYAVARAHAAGVVHGGIKPTNVLRREVDGRQVPVLADFGGELRAHPWMPPARAVIPAGYRAPEGDAQGALTPQGDVYALGVLLSTMAGSLATPAVELIIARATAADLDVRYSTAQGLLDALTGLSKEDQGGAVVAPGIVTPESVPEPEPEPDSESEVPSIAVEAVAPEDSAHATPEERQAQRARILNSESVAKAERGYRSKGLLIGTIAGAALLVLTVTLLLTRNNFVDRPKIVAAPSQPTTTPGYRSVVYNFDQPAGDSTEIQVQRGSTWVAVGGTRYRLGTTSGGDKGCANFRVADLSDSPATFSEVRRYCGVSAQPTITAVVDTGDCPFYGQVCYTFSAGGLKPGLESTLTLTLDGQVIGTIDLTVDPSGHASLPDGQHFHFEITESGKTFEVDFAGLHYSSLVSVS